MNQIYDKINRHEYLDNNDIVKIITFFSKGKVKTEFKNNLHAEAMFLSKYNKILIDNNIKNKYLEILKAWLESYDIEDKITPLFDLYNIYMLWTCFHELGHFLQAENIKNKPTPRIKIINAICDIAHLNETNYNIYINNCCLYYHELDANLLAIIKISNVIKNKCPNLNHTSILIYNRIIAGYLCDSYRNETEKQVELYPILYARLLLKRYYNIFRRIYIEKCIQRLEKHSLTEYRKLLNGFDLSDETIKIFHDVYNGNYETDNILEEVKKIDKVKVR